MNKDKFLNTYINNITMDETVQNIEQMIQKGQKTYVTPINVDVVMKMEKDEKLKEIIDNADIVLADGKPLIWISKLKNNPIKEKVSGSDLVPQLCELSNKKGYTMFILGGKEGIAEIAKKNLEKEYSNIKILGTYAPPFGFENDQKELEKINEMISLAKPDLLFVCFGFKKTKYSFSYKNNEFRWNRKCNITIMRSIKKRS